MLTEPANANQRVVETKMVVEGGATLADLMEMGALDSIRVRGWDVVVLNEQSTWGVTRFVVGHERVPEAPDAFLARIDSFARTAEEVGARLVLIVHPHAFGHRGIGLLATALFAAFGFDGLAHYYVAPLSRHTITMKVTILSEAAAVLTLLAIVGRSLATDRDRLPVGTDYRLATPSPIFEVRRAGAW